MYMYIWLWIGQEKNAHAIIMLQKYENELNYFQAKNEKM